MIQFNLLPDVKLEYVRAQRYKHTIISACMIATSSAFVIFLLLFLTVNVLQKKSMNDLTGDIKRYSSELKSTPDLDKVLTIQNQLKALPALHADKVAASRTFRYIQQVTPDGISMMDFTNDYTANTMTITGEAANLDKVNTFVDTLKYTTFTDKNVTGQKAFSSVVLTDFTRSADTTTFTITANYDPAIFDNASPNVSLTVPNGVTTTSVTDQPANIFKQSGTSPATKQ